MADDNEKHCSSDEAEGGVRLLSPRPHHVEPVDLPMRIYLLTGILCIVNFSVGFSMSIIAPALIFIEADMNANIAEISAIVSFALLGGLLGSVLSGVLSDAVGRRKTLELGTLMMAISGFGCAFSQSPWQLIVARFIQGFGTSISVVVAGIVLTELAPTRIRGTVGSTSQNFLAVGLIISGFIGYWTHLLVKEDNCWRHMFLTTGISGFLAYVCVYDFMLESPRWLVSRGRLDEAKAALEAIFGRTNSDYVQVEVEKLAHRHRDLAEVSFFKIGDLFQGHNRKPFLITCALKFIQQLTGTAIIVSYMVVLFKDTGAGPQDALLFTALSSLPQLVTMVAGSYLLDVLGRKQLLLLSQAGVIITLFFMGLFKRLFSDGGTHQTAVMIIGVIAFRLFYSLGMGPIPLVLSSEILPFQLRGRGLAISTLLHSLLGFLLTASFPVALSTLGAGFVYWSLAVISLGGYLFIQKVVQETKNLSLEDIETMHRIVLEPCLDDQAVQLHGGLGEEELESISIDGHRSLLKL